MQRIKHIDELYSVMENKAFVRVRDHEGKHSHIDFVFDDFYVTKTNAARIERLRAVSQALD